MVCLSDLGEVLCSCSGELTIFSAFSLIIDGNEADSYGELKELNLHCIRVRQELRIPASYRVTRKKLLLSPDIGTEKPHRLSVMCS